MSKLDPIPSSRAKPKNAHSGSTTTPRNTWTGRVPARSHCRACGPRPKASRCGCPRACSIRSRSRPTSATCPASRSSRPGWLIGSTSCGRVGQEGDPSSRPPCCGRPACCSCGAVAGVRAVGVLCPAACCPNVARHRNSRKFVVRYQRFSRRLWFKCDDLSGNSAFCGQSLCILVAGLLQ